MTEADIQLQKCIANGKKRENWKKQFKISIKEQKNKKHKELINNIQQFNKM